MPRAPDLTDALPSRPPPPPETSDNPALSESTSRGRRVLPIDLATIHVPDDRLRSVDPGTVQQLAASITSIGLQSPIIVRPHPDDTGLVILVAGDHRLEAIRLLGWPSIDAFIIKGSEGEIRLVEIDENLIRKELTPLDRARFLREHKRLCNELGITADRGGDRRSAEYAESRETDDHPAPSWAESTAENIGRTPRSVHRAVSIAEGIPDPLADALSKTPIAQREGDLFRLSKMSPDEQDEVLHSLQEADSPPKTLKQVLPPSRPSPPDADAQLKRLDQAWESADPPAREQFISSLVEGGWINPERAITNAGPPDAD